MRGGALCTDDEAPAERARLLRFHGIDKDAWKRYDVRGAPHYEVRGLGFKYNMLDLQAAIGIHQLRNLSSFICRRRELADRYREALADLPGLPLPPDAPPDCTQSWHLYVVKVLPEVMGLTRGDFMAGLKARNIGSGVHFRAIHTHPFFAEALDYPLGSLPNAEWASERIVSLPLFPLLTDSDLADVVSAIRELTEHGR